MSSQKMKRLILGLFSAFIGLLIVAAVMVVVIGVAYKPDTVAEASLHSDSVVSVYESDKNYWVFTKADAETGLIFCPRSLVKAEAYAPLMHELAEQGILCILVEYPFNLPFMNPDVPKGIQGLFPEITEWYIGGHSLGGDVAASYLNRSQEEFSGLILLASSPEKNISDKDIACLSVYGSDDGVLNMKKYQKGLANLTGDTTEHIIDGGNHSQFGNYGTQIGDADAIITAEAQVMETVDVIVDFIAAHKAS